MVSNYFPTEIMNTVTKYSPNEMIQYLITKYLKDPTQIMNWKRLYYELYRESKISRIYRYKNHQHDLSKIKNNEYLNAIINRINKKYRTYAEVYNHTILIRDEKVNVNGSNLWGQIGLGNISNTNNSTDIEENKTFLLEHHIKKTEANMFELNFPKKVVHVSCGQQYSILLFEDGKIMASGNTDYRQVINKFTSFGETYLSLNKNKVWEKCVMKNKIIWAECGQFHSMILLDNGKVLVFGSNIDRQIHFDTGVDGENYCEWIELPLHLKAIQIACGRQFSMILLENKKVLTSGTFYHRYIYNDGIVELNNAEQIKCGYEHIMILLENGNLLAIGSNSKGQLGIQNDNKSSNKLIKVEFDGEISQIDCSNYSSTIILTNGDQFETNIIGEWKKKYTSINK